MQLIFWYTVVLGALPGPRDSLTVGGIAFPIGLLLYWTTSNLWTMGQQFFVIRNSPAPNTEAFRAKEARDAAKAAKKGIKPAASAVGEEPVEQIENRPAPRQQPKKQTRSQRKSGGQNRQSSNSEEGTNE